MNDKEPSSRLVSTIAQAGFAACLIGYYTLLPSVLPPRFMVEPSWNPRGWNWFGQPPSAALLWAVVLLTALCAVRFIILFYSRHPTDAVVWYCLALAAFLPGVWLLCVTEWDYHGVSEMGCWVGTPIALLTVPSIVFLFDLTRPAGMPLGWYLLRSLAELALLTPAWVYCWVMIEFHVLGWCGP